MEVHNHDKKRTDTLSKCLRAIKASDEAIAGGWKGPPKQKQRVLTDLDKARQQDAYLKKDADVQLSMTGLEWVVPSSRSPTEPLCLEARRFGYSLNFCAHWVAHCAGKNSKPRVLHQNFVEGVSKDKADLEGEWKSPFPKNVVAWCQTEENYNKIYDLPARVRENLKKCVENEFGDARAVIVIKQMRYWYDFKKEWLFAYKGLDKKIDQVSWTNGG